MSENLNVSVSRLNEVGDQSHDGRLSRTIGAKKAVNFTFFYAHIYVGHNFNTFVGLG
ncbi:hypothetical protein D3C73_579520 [compost metagenome]